MGEPASVYREGRPRSLGIIPLGPGVRTYMMTVNARGTLERIDQVLTEVRLQAHPAGHDHDRSAPHSQPQQQEQRFGMTPNG